MLETAIGILIGIVGTAAVSEFVRRRNRIEQYSRSVFDRRLGLYEEMHRVVQGCSQMGNEVIERDDLSKEQRYEAVSAAVSEMAGFCSDHELYISDELATHCVAMLMGLEDIHYIEDQAEKERRMKVFQVNVHLAKRIIREVAGISRLDQLYRSITKPVVSSTIIDYHRYMKKKHGVSDKWD